MNAVTKTAQSLAGDIGRMQRESGMVMATVTSLDDDEIGKPTKCAGWTRAHVIAHLALDAEAMTNLATWAATGREHPDYASREERNADIEAAAGQSAAELAGALERANDRLVAAFEALKDGVTILDQVVDAFLDADLIGEDRLHLVAEFGAIGARWFRTRSRKANKDRWNLRRQ